MTPAEVWFLRAEAALRGLSTEIVKDCYEAGVRASLSQWGAAEGTYLSSTNKPSNYVDAFNAEFDIVAQTDITPAWNESDLPEKKLERIITQKWLACYPEGAEAWTEQRRTGYPKLFPVKVNNSGGKINTEIMIRRIPFPSGLSEDNAAQYQNLKSLLGDDDDGGTRLWWDAGQNNF
jgi:hypothetical protein